MYFCILQEANNIFDLFVYILENLPPWNPYFEVYELANKICNRCKMDLEYPVKRSYGMIITADSLRETKGLFENLTFEKFVQIIRISLKMPCDKEGCGKRNYVQRMINKLPTVFTIALEWEHNETEGEIFDTTSVLATEIDVSVIYQYEGDSAFTKYRLVSMVCSDGDRYNCVAYEDNRWVRHVGSQKKVIGDWDGVLSIFRELHIRSEILFFENVSSYNCIHGYVFSFLMCVCVFSIPPSWIALLCRGNRCFPRRDLKPRVLFLSPNSAS
ncbi:T23K8.8 [Arabidopsis thaliana]|uniref:T23K8.8 n=1 Tax=Arabidopsis thaliana TaxID=3702 RepID=Q9S9J7_ARATH|nr:T23K8.8 [Arabidopsis thaliana]